MKNSFLVGWKAQIFYFFGAYCIFRAAQVLTGFGIEPRLAAHKSWLPVSLLLTAAAAVSFYVGRLLGARDLAAGDLERTRLAEAALQEAVSAASASAPRKLSITLYLRPFQSTNAFRYRGERGSAGIGTPDFYETEAEHDLERRISEAMQGTAPLVALGQPGEHYGAGRIVTSDDEWKKTVETLGEAARYILILPSYNEGTLWEIGWLKSSGNLDRTVFVMPPAPRRATFRVGEFWGRTFDAVLKQHSISLPIYRKDGALFRCSSSGSVVSIQPFPVNSADVIADCIRKEGGDKAPNHAVHDYMRIAVPTLKSRRISYYAIGCAFLCVTIAVSLTEGIVVNRQALFGTDFERTFDYLISQTAGDKDKGQFRKNGSGVKSAEGNACPETSAGRDDLSGAMRTISPVGLATSASLAIPASWSCVQKTQNAILLRPSDPRVACNATSMAQKNHPAHDVVFATISEKELLRRAIEATARMIEKQQPGVSERMMEEIRSQTRIDIEIGKEDFDGPVWGYTAEGRTRFVSETFVSRVALVMNTVWAVRLDCTGREDDMASRDAEIAGILSSLSIAPAADRFKLMPGTLEMEKVNIYIAWTRALKELNQKHRAVKAATVGRDYILATAKRDEKGRLSLDASLMKAAYLSLQAGNMLDEAGDTKGAKEHLEFAVRIYDAAKITDDKLVQAARERLSELGGAR